jgi:hypothetical protein
MQPDLLTRRQISEHTGIPKGSVKRELFEAGIFPKETVIENGIFKYLYEVTACKKVVAHIEEKKKIRKASTIRMISAPRPAEGR